MSLESKLAEARRHLQQLRERQQAERESEEREQLAKTHIHWTALLRAAEQAIGSDLAPAIALDPTTGFSWKSNRCEVTLNLPSGGEVYAAFGCYENANGVEGWFPDRTDASPRRYRVPTYDLSRDEDDTPVVHRTVSCRWHETDDLLEALGLALEEGGKRKQLEAQAAEMLRCPTPKGPRNKPPQLSPSDRLLAALRDVIREMLPEV